MPGTSTIAVHLYDGSRNLLPAGQEFLITTRGGGASKFKSGFFPANPAIMPVKFHDNADDNYTVLASLKSYEDAGFMPLPVKEDATHKVHLMLLARNGTFRFRNAKWSAILGRKPALHRFFSSDPNAAERYGLLEDRPQHLACLLNICTAIESAGLLDQFKSIDLQVHDTQDGLKPDRFFAWVLPSLMKKLPDLTIGGKKIFETADPALHGPTATLSFKEIRFDEANLQFTFHEKAPRRKVGTEDCVKVEMDIDFFKDKGAHFILEVIPNTAARKLHLGPGLTDPRVVYAMRWMAGKNANEEFNPLYEIA